MPKVTTFAAALAAGATVGYYSGMRAGLATLRRLFEPINLAAYLTWLAVLLAMVFDGSAGAPVGVRREAALLLMGGFLLVFVLLDLTDRNEHPVLWHALLGLLAAVSVLLCALWTRHAAVPVLTIIVLAIAAMRLSVRGILVMAAVLNLGLWAVFDHLWQAGPPWISLMIFGGFQAFAALTAWYARRAQETAAMLQQSNAHLLATRSLLEASARDQERLRLARDLHDVAGHKLTALKLNLTLLQRQAEVQQRAALDVVSRLAAELLDDLRGVVAQLRESDGMDVGHALRQMAASWPHPKVHLELPDAVRMDNVMQAEALLRAAQEALTNVARHANANNAWISVSREDDVIRLQVHDDGRGAEQLQEGNGIKGMRERLAELGGSLQLSRAPTGGLAVDVKLPVHVREAPGHADPASVTSDEFRNGAALHAGRSMSSGLRG